MDENNNSKDVNNEDINITGAEEVTETNEMPVSDEVTVSDEEAVSVPDEEKVSTLEEEILLPTDSNVEVKKSISPKLIGLGALLLAIILIAVFVLNSPKRKIASAIVKTSKSIEKTVSNFDTPDGYFNTVKKLSTDSYSANITFAEDSVVTPPSFGLYFDSFSLINDKKNKQASFNVGLSGEDYFSGALSNETGYLSLAENSYFFNPKTFGSEFVKWAEANQQYFNFDLLELTNITETSTFTYDDLTKRFSSSVDFLKYQNAILKNAVFTSEKVSYLIDDVETSGEKINVDLSPEDIKATLVAIKTDNPNYPITLEDIETLEINESTVSFTIVKGLVYAMSYDDGISVLAVNSNISEPARKFAISTVSPSGNTAFDIENLMPVGEKGMDYHIDLSDESGEAILKLNFKYIPTLPENNLKMTVTLFIMGQNIDITLNSMATNLDSKALLNLSTLVFGPQEPMTVNMNSVVEKYAEKLEIPVGDSNLLDHSYPAILGYDESLIPDESFEVPSDEPEIVE